MFGVGNGIELVAVEGRTEDFAVQRAAVAVIVAYTVYALACLTFDFVGFVLASSFVA